MKKLIYIPVWMIVLVNLHLNPKINMFQLSVRTAVTYAYIVKIINELSSKGYIITEKTGRERCCTMTVRGHIVAKLLVEVLKEVENETNNTG